MSSSDSWIIVLLHIEEGSVEVIPTKCLVNDKSCLWPNSFSISKLTSVIKHQFNTENNWKKCNVKRLCKTSINNFKLASKISNQATITSDVESLVVN